MCFGFSMLHVAVRLISLVSSSSFWSNKTLSKLRQHFPNNEVCLQFSSGQVMCVFVRYSTLETLGMFGILINNLNNLISNLVKNLNKALYSSFFVISIKLNLFSSVFFYLPFCCILLCI